MYKVKTTSLCLVLLCSASSFAMLPSRAACRLATMRSQNRLPFSLRRAFASEPAQQPRQDTRAMLEKIIANQETMASKQADASFWRNIIRLGMGIVIMEFFARFSEMDRKINCLQNYQPDRDVLTDIHSRIKHMQMAQDNFDPLLQIVSKKVEQIEDNQISTQLLMQETAQRTRIIEVNQASMKQDAAYVAEKFGKGCQIIPADSKPIDPKKL